MDRGIYDIDRKSNGQYLAETEIDKVSGVTDKLPTHSGSHPKWDQKVKDVIKEFQLILESEYGTLKNVPDEVLSDVTLEIENQLNQHLQNWTNPKLN